MPPALRGVLTAQGLEKPRFAVVLPLEWNAQGGHLLVEVRASGIPQAGDPCFPGGGIEEGESPAQAASREMEEELGIVVPPARFLGQLPTVKTYLGSLTDVFVCTVSPEQTARIRRNPAEVYKLLRVPLDYVLERPDASVFPYEGESIWGMTAGVIRSFCSAWRAAEQRLPKTL